MSTFDPCQARVLQRGKNTTLMALITLMAILGLLPSCFPVPQTWPTDPTYAPPSQTSTTTTTTQPPAVAAPTTFDISGYQGRFQTLGLTRGFRPDPQSVTGYSGGDVDAAYLGTSATGPCRGFAQATPNHIMTLLSPFDMLQLDVNSAVDTTLVVYGPDGWLCNDDSQGRNPGIQRAWRSGTYRIWVGSTNAGYGDSYSLSATAGVGVQVVSDLDEATYSSRYQSVRLVPGFAPDPQVLQGTSGSHAPIDATYLGNTAAGPCRGVADALPHHIVNLTGPFNYLRLDVDAQGDTTLVVHGPTGWLCNDDAVGLNPRIEGAFPAGMLRIWVGSYQGSSQFPYSLSVSQQPVFVGPWVQPGSEDNVSRYQALALATDFSPDPTTVTGVAGGSMAASDLGGLQTSQCLGFTDVVPSHIVYLNTAFSHLRFYVDAQGDTTLAILGPGGWLCDDDSSGVNPRVEGSFPAGTYRIWVGSYERNTSIDYTLSVSTRPPHGVPPGINIRQPRHIEDQHIEDQRIEDQHIEDQRLEGQHLEDQRPEGRRTDRRTDRNMDRNMDSRLSPGFMPDPQTVNGTTGGTEGITDLGGDETQACNGFAASAPNHVIALDSDFSYLRFDVDSYGDTTLALEGPNGWYCNDDTIGINPRLEGPFPSGTYRIWVGTYYPDRSHAYTLSFSEIAP